jgi:hypothetical protein
LKERTPSSCERRNEVSSAHIEGDPTELQAEIDVVLRRFSEFQNLEGAFGRRAITEWAKEREALELLRSHSRRTGRKLVRRRGCSRRRPRSATRPAAAAPVRGLSRHKEARVSTAER